MSKRNEQMEVLFSTVLNLFTISLMNEASESILGSSWWIAAWKLGLTTLSFFFSYGLRWQAGHRAKLRGRAL